MAKRHMICQGSWIGATLAVDSLTELQEIAAREKPWVIVLTETKFTDKWADRQLLKPFLPQYKLYHSCEKGKEKQL